MRPIRLVVFDLAGTTVDDDGGVVLKCLVDAARANDLGGTDEELNALMGLDKIEVFRILAARRHADGERIEAVARAALGKFIDSMRAAYDRHLAPVAGAEDVFAFLRSRGIKVAVDTGFDAMIGGFILDRLRWLGRLVDVSVFSSEVPRGRPAPYMIFRAMERTRVDDVRQVMKVGDSPADLEEGSNAGCGEVIGVLSGAHDVESLGLHRHTRIIRSVADVPALFG